MKNIIAVLSLFSLLVSVTSVLDAAPSTTVEEILQKHIEALGGEQAIRSINSVISTSEIELQGTGIKGTMKSYSLKPCLSYSEVSLGFFNIKQGYDGDRIWAVDPNGMLQFKLDPGSLENQVTSCLLESYGYLFDAEGVMIKTAGADTIQDTPCEVLEIIPEGGSLCRIYLDISNYLIKQIVIDSSDGRTVQSFDDYRSVEGMMMPFMTTVHNAAANQTIVMRTQSIDINSQVDPVIFLPPPGGKRDYRFTRGWSAEEIPFVYRHRHIYLPARIGGKIDEVMFLLDSGAGMTVIDSALAHNMGLPLGGVIPGAGAGGMADFHMTRIPGLRIEGIEFSEQTVIAYPISDLVSRFTDIEVGGILGYDFLSRLITRINYEKKVISFFEPDSFTPPEPAIALKAPLMHNIFSLHCQLDKKHGGIFLLDTGANSSMLQNSFVEEKDLAAGRRVLQISILGAGGEEKAGLSRFESFDLGGFNVLDPVFALSTTRQGIGAFTGVNGIIGNDILERFTCTLDYRNQRVFLQKNSSFGERFFKDRGGIQIARSASGSVITYMVIPGSPCDKAGFRAGDEILSIDGRDASAYANLEEITRLFEAEEGTTIKIVVLRDGSKKSAKIVLRSYL